METQLASGTNDTTDIHHGIRARLEDAGHIVAAVSNPVSLFNYVRTTIKERPWMAALAVGGFLAMMVARRRRR